MFTMDELLSKRNQRDAFNYFQQKKSGCGADGMPLSELEDYWKLNHQTIISQLYKSTYEPGVIKCTEIVSNKGKRRVISNLCTIDRFISRLLYQKLKRYIGQEFLEFSYAYQDNKGILDAVQKARTYISAGDKFVAEIDLKNFFDMIPQEKMMELIKTRIHDDRVTDLIWKYIRCKVSMDGKIEEKTIGLVQGNPISTVLSNLYLHRLDLYMEQAGFHWIRFADDINIYCTNEESAIQTFNEVSQFITNNLIVPINEKKSGVYQAIDRILLGYEIYKYKGQYEIKKYKYHKTNCFHNWHDSALQKVNHEYHILQNGVLNKKDYSLVFENDKEKCDIPVGVVDQINIYSDITISTSALRLISEKISGYQ